MAEQLEDSLIHRVTDCQIHKDHLAFTLYDFVWLCMTMYEYLWLSSMTMFDYEWLYMTFYDYVWQFMNMFD